MTKTATPTKKLPTVRKAAPTAVGASYNLTLRVAQTATGRKIFRDCF